MPRPRDVTDALTDLRLFDSGRPTVAQEGEIKQWQKKGEHRFYDRSKAMAGSGNCKAKLNEGEIAKIREMRSKGSTYSQLMSKFNISKSTVVSIVKKQSWKHI